MGRLDSIPCFAGCMASNGFDESRYKLMGIRQLFGLIEDEMFWLAARASHLVNWDRNTHYCGRCGSRTVSRHNEHSKLCPSCNLSIYPKISPAIIVAITKGDKILLAHNALNKSNFYSVLAGFVEPGENLEECVVREVKEEAGIDVKNVRYFGSQPWPFPDSLMVGFTAEYAGGELVLDKNELSDAGWFSVDELPPIPGKISVAYKLINWFIESQKNKTL
jgi:NAD+ diphosphatase